MFILIFAWGTGVIRPGDETLCVSNNDSVNPFYHGGRLFSAIFVVVKLVIINIGQFVHKSINSLSVTTSFIVNFTLNVDHNPFENTADP